MIHSPFDSCWPHQPGRSSKDTDMEETHTHTQQKHFNNKHAGPEIDNVLSGGEIADKRTKEKKQKRQTQNRCISFLKKPKPVGDF